MTDLKILLTVLIFLFLLTAVFQSHAQNKTSNLSFLSNMIRLNWKEEKIESLTYACKQSTQTIIIEYFNNLSKMCHRGKVLFDRDR